jgi:hypothetical protein
MIYFDFWYIPFLAIVYIRANNVGLLQVALKNEQQAAPKEISRIV